MPTWNYAIVHAYGRPAIMNDKDWLRRHVTELSDQQERSEAHPWKVSDAPESYVDVMLRGIVGFRFEITRLEGKSKMSQNRETQDRLGVIDGLKARASGDDLEIAETVTAQDDTSRLVSRPHVARVVLGRIHRPERGVVAVGVVLVAWSPDCG